MRWLEQNADRIEELMASLRVSAGKAKKLVRDNNRPLCLCCNNPIRGGQSGKNFFCSKTRACKTGQNSYHYYRRQGYKDALHRAVVAAHKERLIELAISQSKGKAA